MLQPRKLMKTMLSATLCLLCSSLITGNTSAQGQSSKQIKVGFGFDQGFGVTGSLGNFNGFLGNDGITIDYLFSKQKIEADAPLLWYVGGGGYITWDSDFGARVPVGLELTFAKQWDGYVQIIPGLQIVDDTEFEFSAGVGVRYQF
jgi:hypothetical protein